MRPASQLRYRKLWTACGACFVLLVAFLSLMPDPPHTHRLMGVKPGHFLAYAWLMFWFAQVYPSARMRLLIAGCFCAFGMALEFMQSLTDYRTFSYSDMRDNAFGLAAGLWLMLTPLRGMLAAVESAMQRLIRRQPV